MVTQHETDFPGFHRSSVGSVFPLPQLRRRAISCTPTICRSIAQSRPIPLSVQVAGVPLDRQSANRGHPSTRFGLFHGIIAGSIVVIVASVALGLFGLFTIHREKAEVAATHNQSPPTTPSVMIVDDPQKAEEALSVDVGHIAKLDLRTGALKGTKPAGAAPELPAHPGWRDGRSASSTEGSNIRRAPCVYQSSEE